jgi:hypothetical protein
MLFSLCNFVCHPSWTTLRREISADSLQARTLMRNKIKLVNEGRWLLTVINYTQMFDDAPSSDLYLLVSGSNTATRTDADFLPGFLQFVDLSFLDCRLTIHFLKHL